MEKKWNRRNQNSAKRMGIVKIRDELDMHGDQLS